MEIFIASALLFLAGSAISILTWLLIREKRQTAVLLEQQAETQKAVQLRQLDIIEKNFAQLRSSDPWQYQSIQAVANPSLYDAEYDPSPEAEATRIAERNNAKEELEETLNAEESAALSDIFPGGFPG